MEQAKAAAGKGCHDRWWREHGPADHRCQAFLMRSGLGSFLNGSVEV